MTIAARGRRAGRRCAAACWPRVWRTIAVWSALALVAWLDHGRAVSALHAGILGAVWSALSALGAFIATAAEITVEYLFIVVTWLSQKVASILLSTGAMFSRVWHVVEVFYGDVVKPALLYIDDKLQALRGWLTDTIKPALDFLARVRDALKGIYETFVQPVLDALDVAHAILKTLADLHIAWAQKLDGWIVQAEQAITENWLKIVGALTRVQNVLNAVVTGELLFQRTPYLRSFLRDVRHAQRALVKASQRDLTGAQEHRIAKALSHPEPDEAIADTLAWLQGEPSTMYISLDNGVDAWRAATIADEVATT